VAPHVHLHLGAAEVAARLGPFDLPETPFPHLLFVRQAVVETVLAQALAARDVPVQRGVDVVGLRPGSDGVTALLGAEGTDRVTARYVAGCDGARSAVRDAVGVPWRGGPYRQEAVLADVELDADLVPGVAHIAAAAGGLVFLFALGEQATWRLLATRAAAGGPPAGGPGEPVPAEELQALLDGAGLAAQVTRAPWSARVPLQHRLASRFRSGRVFVVGDAAHTWSPAGGQGMNTGIQDGLNLGWKLAFASGAGAPGGADPLLDSYDLERRPAARRLLAMTHALFWAEAGTGPVPSFVRVAVAPRAARVLPLALRCDPLVARAVRTVSQLRAGYRRSPLSVDGAPGHSGVRPGERLPDAAVSTGSGRRRLHDLVAEPGIHVLLDESVPGDVGWCRDQVRHHRVAGGLGAPAVVVRPDGYVGFRGDPGGVGRWLGLVHAGAALR
jgi:2-polyprenyl-6-methoxyphenol hydroxylase-like FAD-dependent oxidoreductase